MRRLACLLLLACLPAFAAGPQVRAIVGATLVNPGAAPVPDAVVLVRDGRIVDAGARGTVAIPADAERIDAAGKWLVPGYIDAHVHFFQSGGLYTRPDAFDLREVVPYEQEIANIRANLDDTFRRTLRSGITTVADVGGPMANFDVREQAKASRLAPRVFVAGPLVSTWKPPVLSDLADPPIVAASTPEQARALVREQAALRPDFLKLWFVLNPGETPQQFLPVVKAAIVEAHASQLRVAVHATELETARAALQAGADVLVHSVEDAPLDDAFIALLKQRDVPYIPTLAVADGYPRVALRAPALNAEERAWGNPDVIATFDDLNRLSPDYVPAGLVRAWKAGRKPPPVSQVMLKNLKAAQDAGVLVATGTDAGNPGTLHGASYFRELRLMAQAGLTPAQILSDSTLGGARMLAREDELGSIAKGKFADLVVLDADPLASVDNFSRIHAVMKNGELFAADSIVGEGPKAKTQRNPDAFRTPGPQDEPEAVVQRQLEAYNAHDIDAFLATYSPDVELFTLGGERQSQGLEAMRARYGKMFQDVPKLRCQVLRRIVQGNLVIDHEHLTGLPDGSSFDGLAIYEVRRGKIRRVWFPQ